MQAIGIIPARYASSRFPGKPLALILGKPMFWHVARRAAACPDISRVVLATDDTRILAAAGEWGVEAVMTSPDHASGTDRILEAAEALGLDDEQIVVNIQGDEPALDPGMLTQLLGPFHGPSGADVQVTTLAREIEAAKATRTDTVKAVVAANGRALYFSRQPVPHCSGENGTYWAHIGLYAFRARALRGFSRLGPSPLERREQLEQLRLLEAHVPIHVVPTSLVCHGVDRPEDVAVVENLLSENT